MNCNINVAFKPRVSTSDDRTKIMKESYDCNQKLINTDFSASVGIALHLKRWTLKQPNNSEK